jgi:hypothetical protein
VSVLERGYLGDKEQKLWCVEPGEEA